MNPDLERLTVQELTEGVRWDGERAAHVCVLCGQSFAQGEIFSFGGRLFEADRAAKEHVRTAHPDLFGELLAAAEKYATLTDRQQELLRKIAVGKTDRDIAEELGVSASTVRTQRFQFREKAKQAKLYLALYELSMERGAASPDAVLPVPETTPVADERFNLTAAEQEKILSTVFKSQSPLKLKVFSAKEKKKVVIITRIAQEFQRGRNYTEKEVNAILKDIFPDFATLRRYLIEYGFMDRKPDCSVYWKK